MVRISEIVPCSVESCVNNATCRGYCQTHYSRWFKWGDPLADVPIRREKLKPIDESDRTCRVCNRDRSITKFKWLRVKERYHTVCMDCVASWQSNYQKKKREEDEDYWVSRRLKYNYKLTMEDFEAMMTAQGGRCAICKRTPEESANRRHKRLVVDHDHACCPGMKSCGKCVRGLLCYSCNSALGAFFDSVEVLDAAAAYRRSFD